MVPRGAVCPYVDQQGLRGWTESSEPGRAGDPLGLRRPGIRHWNQREFSHRSMPPFSVRGVTGGSGRDGARVWPLLPDANLLSPRWLCNGTKPLRRRTPRVPQLPDQVQSGEKRVPSRQPRKSFGARGRSKLFSSAPDLLPPQLGI
jgi:hypothetical protein